MKEFVYSNDKGKIIDFLLPKFMMDEAVEVVDYIVLNIIRDVAKQGDKALIKYTKKFDKVDLNKIGIRMDESEIKKYYDKTNKDLIRSLETAAQRIEEFHKHQLRKDWKIKEDSGIELTQRYIPLERVGIYVPGWKASYPSSVLMNAIPAKVAGVKEIVMTSPFSQSGEVNTAVYAAAYVCGIKEIYKIGGAQAIAALALGTESVPKVDKVVGPGNKYVASAKKLVYGIIDIDMIAGPSEILIIADGSAPIEYIAADMLSQAEHDEDATAITILIGDCDVQAIKKEIIDQSVSSPRSPIIRKSLKQNGAIISVDTVEDAVELANLKAPEHLEMMFKGADRYVSQIKNAGAIFVGRYTPEAIGDYVAGPNHVLPTGGTARFFSPLGVDDFVKKNHVVKFSEEALVKLSKPTIKIAEEEGLFGHANSIKVRL